MALVERPYCSGAGSQKSRVGATAHPAEDIPRPGLHDGDLRAVSARYPDETRAVERIVRSDGHVNRLPDMAGGGVDACERRLPIDDQPDAVGAAGDPAFAIRRANPGDERHLASTQIDARDRVWPGAKRNPDTSMPDCKSCTRVPGQWDGRDEPVRMRIDLADCIRPARSDPYCMVGDRYPVRSLADTNRCRRRELLDRSVQAGRNFPGRRSQRPNCRDRDDRHRQSLTMHGACVRRWHEDPRASAANERYLPAAMRGMMPRNGCRLHPIHRG